MASAATPDDQQRPHLDQGMTRKEPHQAAVVLTTANSYTAVRLEYKRRAFIGYRNRLKITKKLKANLGRKGFQENEREKLM
jgi:hypothetical protein